MRKQNIISSNICHQEKYRILVLLNMVGNQTSSEAVLVQAVDRIRGVDHAPDVKRDFAFHVEVQERVLGIRLVTHFRMSISYILMLDRENYIEFVDVRYFEGIEFQLFSILSS